MLETHPKIAGVLLDQNEISMTLDISSPVLPPLRESAMTHLHTLLAPQDLRCCHGWCQARAKTTSHEWGKSCQCPSEEASGISDELSQAPLTIESNNFMLSFCNYSDHCSQFEYTPLSLHSLKMHRSPDGLTAYQCELANNTADSVWHGWSQFCCTSASSVPDWRCFV
jgi:hypothetical protein